MSFNKNKVRNNMKTIFDEVIASLPIDWDGSIVDLTDKAKDKAVFAWLTAHPSWIEECLPECAYNTKDYPEIEDLLIDHLYGYKDIPFLNQADHGFGSLMKEMRIRYSASHAAQGESVEPEQLYSCEAYRDFQNDTDGHLNANGDFFSFAELYREHLYLYLESRLESEILAEMGRTIH
tara:strand:+ start:78 stop:611 length:534 start_codon:yes stop_codon:yes gene_type:complete